MYTMNRSVCIFKKCIANEYIDIPNHCIAYAINLSKYIVL